MADGVRLFHNNIFYNSVNFVSGVPQLNAVLPTIQKNYRELCKSSLKLGVKPPLTHSL